MNLAKEALLFFTVPLCRCGKKPSQQNCWERHGGDTEVNEDAITYFSMMNPYQQNYYPPQQPQQELSGLHASTKVFFAIAIPLIWFIALWLPAYSNGTKGGVCLLFGWSMLFTGNGWAFFAWLANFPFWIGYFMFALSKRKKPHVAVIVLAAISLVFSVGALTVTKIESDISSGVGMEHVESSIGAWTWMFSIAILLVGSVISVTSTAELPMPSFAQQFNQPPANYYQNYPPQAQPYYPPQNYPPQYPQQQYPQPIPPAQIPPPPAQAQENLTKYQPPQNPPPPTDDVFPSEIPTTYVPPTDNPFAPPKE